VQKTFVQRGDHVQAGQKLVELDKRDVLLSIESANIAKEKLQLDLRHAEENRADRFAAAESQLKKAELQVGILEKEWQRLQVLYDNNAVPKADEKCRRKSSTSPHLSNRGKKVLPSNCHWSIQRGRFARA
jgi:multidrug resistance efflux pump